MFVITVSAGALEGLLGRGAGRVGDGDEEVLAGEDVDGHEDGNGLRRIVGVRLEADGLEDSEGVVCSGVHLDALVFAACVFDVERMEVILLCQFVEPGVVGVFKLIPGHGATSIFLAGFAEFLVQRG